MDASRVDTSPSSCWFCGDGMDKKKHFFCDNCSYLQSPHPDTTYFQLFDIQQQYRISYKELEERYKALQRAMHPDKHARMGGDIVAVASSNAARLNDAYAILKCPLARAKYLLEVQGQASPEEATISDTMWLAEVLDIQEAATEASEAKEIARLRDDNMARRQNVIDCIAAAYETENWPEMRRLVQQLAYWNRVEATLLAKSSVNM